MSWYIVTMIMIFREMDISSENISLTIMILKFFEQRKMLKVFSKILILRDLYPESKITKNSQSGLY